MAEPAPTLTAETTTRTPGGVVSHRLVLTGGSFGELVAAWRDMGSPGLDAHTPAGGAVTIDYMAPDPTADPRRATPDPDRVATIAAPPAG